MNQTVSMNRGIQLEDILIAYRELKEIVLHTPLQKNERLSEKYECQCLCKTRRFQHVRSFKLRGAYYKIKTIDRKQHLKKESSVPVQEIMHKESPFACAHLGIDAKIYMPTNDTETKS